MRFGLRYDIEVPRRWAETPGADSLWKAREQATAAEAADLGPLFVVDDAALAAGG